MPVKTQEKSASTTSNALAKPKLRGWLHAGMTPIALAAGLVLVVLTPTVPGRAAAAIYTVGLLILFGNSALYHTGPWDDRTRAIFRKLDHSNIFIFIAATYTPLTVQLLTGDSRTRLLIVIWACAVVGVLARVLWMSAPRWLYTALYIAMGWVALWWMPDMIRAGGWWVVGLVVAGGVIYTAGAIIYAIKRPNPAPRWYGFHEIFHSCTILAAICHYVAIWLATF